MTNTGYNRDDKSSQVFHVDAIDQMEEYCLIRQINLIWKKLMN